MNPLEILQLARADLACYAVAQWPGFELAAHHRLLVEMLEAVERGEIRRLLVAWCLTVQTCRRRSRTESRTDCIHCRRRQRAEKYD